MANALTMPPFPPLSWDGLFWRAPLAIPWYAQAETTEFVVRPDYSRSCEPVEPAVAPRPTDDQVAAFRSLFDPGSHLPATLREQFRRFVPELAGLGWDEVRAFFELATVAVFHASWDRVSYVGLVFNCRRWESGYEHGVGVTAHLGRVVHFGVAEEAQDEGQAQKDRRRQTRNRRSKSG